MERYIKHFKEQDAEIDDQKEFEEKQAQKLIKYLTNTTASNYDTRVEFAKTIFQLSLSSSKEARKFIKQLSIFCRYWGDDNYISEEEWHKLNNSEEE